MILLDSITWMQLVQLLVITAVPVTACLIGYLTYIRGHFESQREERKMKQQEQNENREMYIKMVVKDTIDGQIKEIHEMVEKMNKRIDDLFKVLTK